MKIRSRFLIRLAARSLSAGIRLLFRTLDLDVRLQVPGISPYVETGDERFIYCVWHDSILGPTFGGPQTHVAALTSQHTDGTLVADLLESVGITPIRGSSSRGGARAVKQMMEAARNHHIVIATDGPRGPRREVKDGIVYLAAQTGRAVIPVTFAARSCWRPRGKWTDLIVPKPFAQSVMLAGEPIRVPARLTKDGRAHWRGVVQQAMDELDEAVNRMAAGEDVPFERTSPQRRAA